MNPCDYVAFVYVDTYRILAFEIVMSVPKPVFGMMEGPGSSQDFYTRRFIEQATVFRELDVKKQSAAVAGWPSTGKRLHSKERVNTIWR